MTTIHDLERRIDTLQSQVTDLRKGGRRYRTAIAGLSLVLVGALAIAADDELILDVVKARRFEVIDSEGNLVVAARASATGGQLDLWSTAGRNTFRASATAQGGDLAIWNATGANVFGAYATAGGGEVGIWGADGRRLVRAFGDERGGLVSVHNNRQEPVAMLAAGDDGGSVMAMRGDGQTAFHASAGETGGAAVVFNPEGRPVVTLEADPAGAGVLAVSDAQGAPRCVAAVNAYGGQVQVLGEGDRPLVTTGANQSGGAGEVSVFNATGHSVFSATAGADHCGRLDVGLDDGRSVFTVNALKETGAAMALLNASGQNLFLAGTRPEGGLLNVLNSRGVPVVIAGFSPDTRGGALSVNNGRGLQVFHAGVTEDDHGIVRVWDADQKRERKLMAPWVKD